MTSGSPCPSKRLLQNGSVSHLRQNLSHVFATVLRYVGVLMEMSLMSDHISVSPITGGICDRLPPSAGKEGAVSVWVSLHRHAHQGKQKGTLRLQLLLVFDCD
jgi:hypothetical protein